MFDYDEYIDYHTKSDQQLDYVVPDISIGNMKIKSIHLTDHQVYRNCWYVAKSRLKVMIVKITHMSDE